MSAKRPVKLSEPPKKNGGARPGAGRPVGSKNRPKLAALLDIDVNPKGQRNNRQTTRKSAEVAMQILEGSREGLKNKPELPDNATPLDVMLEAMRVSYKHGGAIGAFPYAEKAAPYLHARIAQVELRNPTASNPDGTPTAQPFRFEVEFVAPKPQATPDEEA